MDAIAENVNTALELARKGFAVFPVIDKRPPPGFTGGFRNATRDAQTIEAWWERWPEAQVAIWPGACEPRLAGIDIDVKNGAPGMENALELAEMLPPTLEGVTPSNGRHLLYRVPADFAAIGNRKLAPGIDVRADEGYLVHHGEYNGRALADAPPALLARLSALGEAAAERSEPGKPAEGARIDSPHNIARATVLAIQLLREGPKDRYRKACQIKDAGVSPAMCLEIMRAAGFPEEGQTSLAEKIASAYRYGQDAPGSRTPEHIFREQIAAGEQTEAQEKLEGNGFPRFLSADAFIALYKPQKPLVREWDMRPGYIYSFTAPTGGAKTAIALCEAIRLAAEGYHVVYLAGENPDDVMARVVLMKAKLGLDKLPSTLRFVPGTFSLEKGFEHVRSEVTAMGGAHLIIVDTGPAFQVMSGGSEENSNNEQLSWALVLRQLSKLQGNPTVLALCHPRLRPNGADDCIPRGGSAFLAEVDGNYVSWPAAHDGERKFYTLRWAGKFRGHFEPLTYGVEVATCAGLMVPGEAKPGLSVWAFRAEGQQVERAATNQTEDDAAVVLAMKEHPKASLSDLAQRLGWHMPSGPAKYRVERVMKRLAKRNMTEQGVDGHWRLKSAGRQEAKRLLGL